MDLHPNIAKICKLERTVGSGQVIIITENNENRSIYIDSTE